MRKIKKADDPFAFLDKPKRPRRPRSPTRMSPGHWPDEVRILIPEDLCRHAWHDGHGRHDLGGWLEVVFDSTHPAGYLVNTCHHKAERVLYRVLRERSGKKRLALWEFCEQTRYTEAWLCACWNEAMRRLGYDLDPLVCEEPS